MRAVGTGVALALSLLAGCAPPTSPLEEVGVTVQVRRGASSMEPDVLFEVRNSGGRAVYLTRCADRIMVVLDRWEQTRWQVYSSDRCEAGVQLNQLRLEPGASAKGAQSIHNIGRFRVRVGLAATAGATPTWSTHSDEFTLP